MKNTTFNEHPVYNYQENWFDYAQTLFQVIFVFVNFINFIPTESAFLNERGREGGRERDRQTDRQRERDRERERVRKMGERNTE